MTSELLTAWLQLTESSSCRQKHTFIQEFWQHCVGSVGPLDESVGPTSPLVLIHALTNTSTLRVVQRHESAGHVTEVQWLEHQIRWTTDCWAQSVCTRVLTEDGLHLQDVTDADYCQRGPMHRYMRAEGLKHPSHTNTGQHLQTTDN